MSDEGRLVAGRYRVIKRIGTGAMGAVWQAHDEVLHRTVAIKQLLLQPGLDENEAEDARQRTMREGRIAARLHHPNAISVFDVVMDDSGRPCLIMEYLPSRNLAQELQKHTTLPPIEVAKIGAQIASALTEAHAVGIVHRDIKPGNILLADNGLVKITDFGISRAKDDVTVTKTGMIAGTPAYLAPEVAIGGDPGPESDIFSLGSTLYAASEGQPPFGLSENTLGLLHAVAAGQINPPRRSGPLTSVLAVMLHPEVSHRPTAAECEELLSAVARGETPLGGAGDGPTRAHSGPGNGTAVLGAAGAGAVGGVLGASAADYGNGHSGNLDDEYDDYNGYGDPGDRYAADEYYEEGPPTTAQPRTAYGAHDGYDDYDAGAGNHRDGGTLDRTAVAPAAQPTRATPAVPAETAAYGGRDHGAGRDYDRPPPSSEDSGEKGNWKIPAAIGAVVVVGMAAFAIWIFGDRGGNAPDSPGEQRPIGGTTESWPSSSWSSEVTTTTTQDVVQPENPAQPGTDPGQGLDDQEQPDAPADSTTNDLPSSSQQTTTTDDGGDQNTTTPGDGDGGTSQSSEPPPDVEPTEPAGNTE
ncbi:serine/threonine-protein kinase [Saccharomonospora xinjiangensis]|uniref:serine/threonine-protein kinase n=1 Tax=Saccharomonospora xinjiangensis TaxID=75294 RepID=UPI00106F356F|nr:serine/threonine-protein kinase [Saccharomonospora xinjiangensis]QBQ58925.1 Serine/threonine-protein kinase PknA [Saccharomonospora xinjiangensis]